jgi:hypothetical protein
MHLPRVSRFAPIGTLLGLQIAQILATTHTLLIPCRISLHQTWASRNRH